MNRVFLVLSVGATLVCAAALAKSEAESVAFPLDAHFTCYFNGAGESDGCRAVGQFVRPDTQALHPALDHLRVECDGQSVVGVAATSTIVYDGKLSRWERPTRGGWQEFMAGMGEEAPQISVLLTDWENSTDQTAIATLVYDWNGGEHSLSGQCAFHRDSPLTISDMN